MGFERRETVAIELLQVGVGAGEREIDVVEHVRIASRPACPEHPA